MSEPTTSPIQAIRPEAAFAAVQNGAACWSRAFSHLTEGVMTAAKAQAALAREILKPEPDGWLKPITPENAVQITHEWLARNKARRETLLHGFRQINDDLTACCFMVADDLAEGLSFKNGHSEAPAEVAKPAGTKAAAPAERKAIST